jgi:putative SOS response-associated peptidase YedK
MCARFYLRPSVDQILEFLGARAEEGLDASLPRWNIAPTQDVLTVVHTPAGRELRALRWGLVPPWWRDEKLPVFVNARAESIADKPSFRAAFKARRGLIPASGFYEWTTEGKLKLPHAIGAPDGGLFAMAAIWETATHRGATLRSAAIVTTDAVGAMTTVHDRQPLILGPGDWDTWLDPQAPIDDVAALIRPSTLPLSIRRVGAAVNQVRDASGSWFADAG